MGGLACYPAVNMSKVPKKGPEYSREREFKVILEDLQSQFRVFGEGLEIVRKGLEDVRDRLGRVENRLERVEVRLDSVELRLDRVELRLDRVEHKVDNIELILRPFTATVSDHEKRLTVLEKR